jgi:processive 1,2-diacylglycerol beta-glucosyltransferase
VGSEDLRGEFIRRGFAAEKVMASGIPLRLDFASAEVWQPRRAGGPLRVLILAGGVSSGAYAIDLAWLRELLACLSIPPQDVRLTIVAGSRDKLRVDLERLARDTRFEVYPRGLVGDMAGAMRSHDLLVAKPGGLTVAEALACGLPLAALRPGPGQETANCEFLRRSEVWIEAFTACQAAEAISRAAREPGWLTELGRRSRRLGRPRAALDVAQILLKECS